MITPSDATDNVETMEDAADKLLHSQFLIVDDPIVIGSLNWSEGFYFQLVDWSVVVKSPGLTQEMSTRFDSHRDAAAL